MARKKKTPQGTEGELGFDKLAQQSFFDFENKTRDETATKKPGGSPLPKFGFITDTHFDCKYESRKDDTLKTLLDKTSQCYRWFEENGCEFVIHGGDMFDRHRIYNFDLIRGVRDVLMKSRLTTYFIVGQHDLQGYNMETLPNSNLGFLDSICDGKLSLVEDEADVGGYCLVASHVDDDPVMRVNGVKDHGDRPVVCICHALLTDERDAFGMISISHFKNPNVQLVLSGDLHTGVSFQKMNGIQFYNPGSLARTERSLRMPKVGALWWDGNEFKLEEFHPACPPCEEIFFWEDENGNPIADVEDSGKESNEPTREDYIKSFQEFHSEAKDVYELLIKMGTKMGISEEILDLIKRRRDMKEI